MDFDHLRLLWEEKRDAELYECVKDVMSPGGIYLQFTVLHRMKRSDEAALLMKQSASKFENGTPYEKATYNRMRGGMLRSQGQLDEALQMSLTALGIYEKLEECDLFDFVTPSIEHRIRQTMSSIGIIYDNLGHYTKALEFGTRALEVAEKISDYEGVVNALYNTGYVFHVRGKLSEALERYFKALEISEEHNLMGWAARIHQNIGGGFARLKQDEQAVQHYEKSMDILEPLNPKDWVFAYLLSNLSSVNERLGRVDESEHYFDRLEKLIKINPHPRSLEIYNFKKAIRLKNSKRSIQKAEGEQLLREFINTEGSRYGLKIIALRHLVELVLLEYQTYGVMEAAQEVDDLIQEMDTIARKEKIWSSLIRVLLFKSKLQIVEGNYNSAMDYIEEARQISVKEDLQNEMKLTEEATMNLKEELLRMKGIVNSNMTLSQNMVKDEIKNYIQMALEMIQ